MRQPTRRTDRPRSRTPVALLAALPLLVGGLAAPAAAEHDVTAARVEGQDRYATAAAVAQLAYPDGAGTAVLARADDWPDALSGAPLAGLVDGPVLLTDSATVPQVTQQALMDLGVERVVLLGGTAAIDPEIEDGLGERYDVERLFGADRYETAAAVARAVADRAEQIGATPGGMRSVFLAAGDTFADALAAGAPAALGGAPDDVGERPFPLLLTAPDELPAATSAALDDLPVDQVIIVGGEQAVSPQVADALEQRGLDVVRLAGATRVETAASVADFTVDVLPATPAVVHLARGDVFADALAAGPLAADIGGPLLLTQGPDVLGAGAEQWLATRCPAVTAVRAVGGTAAVSAAVLGQAAAAAERCHAPTAPLASIEYGDDGLTLVTTSLRDGTRTVVADDVLDSGGYDWSPDGSELVYVRRQAEPVGTGQIVVAAADGSGERVLTSGDTDDRYPVFSPDGRSVAFVRGPARDPGSELYVIGADGSGLRQVSDEQGADVLFPSWSPDGTDLVYQSFPNPENGTVEPVEPRIAVVGADGSGQRVLAEQGTQPAWSPDGTLISFVSSQAPGSRTATLQAVQPDGTGLRELASQVAPMDPAWSPDSQRIAFGKQAGELATADLAVVGRDGSGERVLADVRPIDGGPTWSPDGSTLVFTAAFTEGDFDLYAIGADGEGLRALTTDGRTGDAQFAPTG